jgi:fructoselysine-6-P-deglycase FrlB-like protein
VISATASLATTGNGSFIWEVVVAGARESALKVLELTAGKLAAFYDSPTGFRHGPKSLVDNETLVVVLSPAIRIRVSTISIYWRTAPRPPGHARGGYRR